MLPQSVDKSNIAASQIIQTDSELTSNKDVAIWMRFLQQLGLSRLFANLSDQRQQSKITYSNSSLALWGFSVAAFRQGSKNALNTTFDTLKQKNRSSIANFLEIENFDNLPHSKTVDEYLRHLNPDELNNILLEIFSWGHKSKLFYNHAECLSPDNNYLLGCDGFWTHTYTTPHAMDEHGKNSCPYCLPRTRHAGTPQEETYWVHIFVTFVVIFSGGFKLPLYVYALKAHQIDTTQGHDAFKQECELKSAHAVLPIIKSRFSRLSFIFGGDALYSNEPFILLCDSLGLDYLIVRKDNTLKRLGKHCDELAKTELYKKAYTLYEKEKNGKQEVIRQAQWFNNEVVGNEAFTNVLRYEESILDSNRVLELRYKGEWICSKSLSKLNCFSRAKRARMRWEHEDLHNTCKNRGFDAKHDIARADPNLWLIWKLIMFIAFAAFELFRFTKLAQDACKNRSWMKFARDLLQQLVEISWSVIGNSPILQKQKIQFRFSFCDPP